MDAADDEQVVIYPGTPDHSIFDIFPSAFIYLLTASSTPTASSKAPGKTLKASWFWVSGPEQPMGAQMRATSNRTGFDIGKPEDVLLARSIKMLLGVRPAWHSQGACRWSGIDFTSRGGDQQAAALQLCGRCPVRTECLDWAIEVDDQSAILGGMTPAARRRLVNAHRTDTAPTDGGPDATP
jgi:WhiB family redox-sensing transcriptional regulator